MLDTLPAELVRYILHLTAYRNDPNDLLYPLSPCGLKSLAFLSLVHRSWKPFVEDILLTQVYIGPSGPHASLLELLQRRVGEKKTGVRCLVVEAPGESGFGWEGRDDWVGKEGLWKDVRSMRVLQGETRAVRLLHSCMNLESLVVHGTTRNFHLGLPFPHLRKLVIMDSGRLELLEALTPTSAPRLKSLVLDLSMRSLAGYFPTIFPAGQVRRGPLFGGNGGAGGAGTTGLPVRHSNRTGPTRVLARRTAVTAAPNMAAAPRRLAGAGIPPTVNITATPTTTEPSFPSITIFPQITSLTLRVHSSPYALSFLTAFIDSCISSSTLSQLRLETSGAPEKWLAILPLLTVLDTLPNPLATFHVPYALLEPLLYRLSRQPKPTLTLPRCLSALDRLTLANFLGLGPSAFGLGEGETGVVVRMVEDEETWKDLKGLREYIRPLGSSGANGGRGLRIELRKVPKGILED
ncbi:hypothetical protein JCM11641_002215 [Rhodosporidiobolus odoratus]